MSNGLSVMTGQRAGRAQRCGDHRTALLAGALAVAISAVALALIHTTGNPFVAPAPHASALAAVDRMSLQAQGVISTTVADGDPAYTARRTAGGYRLAGGGLDAAVASSGATVLADGRSLAFSLTGVGRGGRERPLADGTTAAHGNRVSITGARTTTWYAAGPLGIEQGFTVARAPETGARGPLTLSLRVRGSLRARRSGAGLVFDTAAGRPVLRYGGLSAVDASGRSLPVSMDWQHGRLVLAIDDRGARYPVRIDPFLEQQKIPSPSDVSGDSAFGTSAAISADGSTALIGGYDDNNDIGAAWVFVRSGTTWTEQAKIAPSDILDVNTTPLFGASVALSADGNTALIGAGGDDSLLGAAWVYTRTGTKWTEQTKIVAPQGFDPIDEIAYGAFGSSVALSANGQVALIGAENDGPPNGGAAWVYDDTGSGWVPETKIIAPDETASSSGVDSSNFGWSVALDAAGTTAIIGGPMDGVNSDEGAAWIYTGSGASWTEAGKLVPADESVGGGIGFGANVAISGDGSTALIGSPSDSDNTGAAWVYTHSGGGWTEQQKIAPTDETVGDGQFGTGVALSDNGEEALIGGDDEASGAGALWVYDRSGTSWSMAQKIAPADEGPGGSGFGNSVALSTDGSTAIVGGTTDVPAGAAWAYSFSAIANPTCTLRAHSASIALPRGTGRAKAAAGTLSFLASCNEAVHAMLAGTVTEVIRPKHGKKKQTKTTKLSAVSATLSANSTTTIVVRVPSSVLAALLKGDTVSAAFVLTASSATGSGTTTAAIPKLKR